ncbi:MAG: MinD/ParA family protein [Bacillota bacterium]
MKREIVIPKIIKSGANEPELAAGAVQAPRIIAVTSGKGGVGKTNLTVNLGLAMASLNRKVIIFDADLGLANAEILLGVHPPYSLYDCIHRNRDIAEVICPAPGGIKIISGGSGILGLANLDDINHRRLMDSLQVLNNLADFILIDTGAGISRNVLAFLAAAEEVIVVVVPEPTSLTDSYGLIKVLAKYNLHREVSLVVNRARNDSEATQTAKKIDQVAGRFLDLKVNYIGFIPESKVVNESVRRQEPFAVYARQSEPARCVLGIARALLGEEAPAKPRHGITGFARKLVRLFR